MYQNFKKESFLSVANSTRFNIGVDRIWFDTRMNARQICHALSGLPHKRGTLKLFTFQHLFKQINQTPMLNLHSILLLPSFISLLSTSFVDGKGLRPRRRMKLAKRGKYND